MAKIVLSFAYQGFRLPLNYKFKQLFLIYELFFYYFYQGKCFGTHLHLIRVYYIGHYTKKRSEVVRHSKI